jgi:hypothetical protein
MNLSCLADTLGTSLTPNRYAISPGRSRLYLTAFFHTLGGSGLFFHPAFFFLLVLL